MDTKISAKFPGGSFIRISIILLYREIPQRLLQILCTNRVWPHKPPLIYTENVVNVDRFIRNFLPVLRPSYLQFWARQPSNRALASSEWSKTNTQTFIPSLAESRNHSSRHGYFLSVVQLFHCARKLPWGSAHSVCDLIGWNDPWGL